MAYKTVIVHLSHDDRYRQRVSVAFDVAARFDAHLECLYTTAPVATPAPVAGRGASHALLAELKASAREHAEEIRREISARCEREGVRWNWQVEESDEIDAIVGHVNLADLVVVTQYPERTLEDHFTLNLPEKIAMEADCPVLVLPHEGSPTLTFEHALVCWKNRREAVRALRGSLDMLRAHRRVTVLTVDPPEHDYVPGVDIGTFLARHGIEANIESDLSDDDTPGEIILAKARDLGCDLIVMGAYGHSKMHEAVFGGTTRHVLTHLDRPLLTAH